MSEPKIYKPSVYNAPTVYNGGGSNVPHVPTDTYTRLLYLRNKGNAWLKIDINCYGLGTDIVFSLNSYTSSNEKKSIVSNRNNSNDVVQFSKEKEFIINNHSYIEFTNSLNISTYEIITIQTRLNNTRTMVGKISWGTNSQTISKTADGTTSGHYITILNESDNPYNETKRIDLYKVNIYNRYNEMLLELVPAKRTSDGIYGMYDLLNNNFYAFEGQGDLIEGPPVE